VRSGGNRRSDPAGERRPESAGLHMVGRIPTARPEDRVGAVRAGLPGQVFDYADAVFLLAETGRLVGTVALSRLLAAQSEARLSDLASAPARAVEAHTDQEKVASLAVRHGLSAVPVVDEQERLLGVVPPEALLEILRHEHVEDLHRLAGIRHETVRARHAIEAPPLRRVRDRLPWLLVGLAGSMLATLVVAYFETALEAKVAIAFFVPGIVYLADAIGTQTEAIAVRGLSLSHAPLKNLVAGELRTGMLIGATLGILAFPMVWVFAELRLAAAVALSLFVAGAMATTVGLLFPWTLARFGRDPAFGSGPIATIVQDVLSLVIYFVVVSVMLA
jgi:magnesium transporter